MCSAVPETDTTIKLYTWKDLVLLEISITEFHENLYTGILFTTCAHTRYPLPRQRMMRGIHAPEGIARFFVLE